jgi:hypothetical protein
MAATPPFPSGLALSGKEGRFGRFQVPPTQANFSKNVFLEIFVDMNELLW